VGKSCCGQSGTGAGAAKTAPASAYRRTPCPGLPVRTTHAAVCGALASMRRSVGAAAVPKTCWWTTRAGGNLLSAPAGTGITSSTPPGQAAPRLDRARPFRTLTHDQDETITRSDGGPMFKVCCGVRERPGRAHRGCINVPKSIGQTQMRRPAPSARSRRRTPSRLLLLLTPLPRDLFRHEPRVALPGFLCRGAGGPGLLHCISHVVLFRRWSEPPPRAAAARMTRSTAQQLL